MKKNKVFGGICILAMGLLLLPGHQYGYEYLYALTSLDSHDFQPTRNTYQFKGTQRWSNSSHTAEFTITVNYYKVPKNLVVAFTLRNPTANGVETFQGKFSAPCGDDPILYDGVTCGPYKKESGSYDALPQVIHSHAKPICALGQIFFPQATRDALRGEYDDLNNGPWTLAPMPVNPKENAVVYSPVTFEAFLPFRFALPCAGWRFTLLLERHDPGGGSYPWKKVDTGDPMKSWEGKNFDCRWTKEMKLAPGKYRYKLQAAHYEKGKTPWSLAFPFQVRIKIHASAMLAAKRIAITSPGGGEMWRIRKEPYYVNWKCYGLPAAVHNGPVKIVLRRGDQWIKALRKNITAKTEASRIYLTDDLPTGGGFFIRIRSTVDPAYFSDSKTFSIVKLNTGMKARKS